MSRFRYGRLSEPMSIALKAVGDGVPLRDAGYGNRRRGRAKSLTALLRAELITLGRFGYELTQQGRSLLMQRREIA